MKSLRRQTSFEHSQFTFHKSQIVGDYFHSKCWIMLRLTNINFKFHLLLLCTYIITTFCIQVYTGLLYIYHRLEYIYYIFYVSYSFTYVFLFFFFSFSSDFLHIDLLKCTSTSTFECVRGIAIKSSVQIFVVNFHLGCLFVFGCVSLRFH